MAESRPRNLPHPSRRRDKPQLSCNSCRRKKLRCDRAQPCGSCQHRGLALVCSYVQPTTGPKCVPRDPKSGTNSGLVDRISQLERLVTSLVGEPNGSKSTDQASLGVGRQENAMNPKENLSSSTPDDTQPSDSCGHMSLRNSKTTYVENTHWTAILDEISELKNSVQEEEVPSQLSTPYSSHDLLFAGCQSVTHKEILAALPPREECDRILADAFENKNIPCMEFSLNLCIGKANTALLAGIHGPSFLRQYYQLWEDPPETPIMWVGKLYGLLCITLYIRDQSMHDRRNSEATIRKYSNKINQCLVLGRYQECPPDTIETLCSTLIAHFLQSSENIMDNLIILGVVIRLAQRMGYHRDASHFPHISSFQGEMRRRVWAVITDLDTLNSAGVGLPRLLREFQSDTAPPRNILDEDFDEDTTELPPSRPSSFETPCQWLVAKNKLISMFGIITDFSTSIRRPGYAEVMHIDKLLHETYKSSPEHLLEKPIDKSIMDSSETIMRRIQLVLLLEKGRCVLHYRYLVPSRTDMRYAYSRDSCLEAALHVLEYHCIVEKEIEPGGRMYSQRWKIATPLIRGEFLLATTLLCLELNYDLSNPAGDTKKIPLIESLKDRIVQALQKSYAIWTRSSDPSGETKKALHAIDVVFKKLHERQETSSAHHRTGSPRTTDAPSHAALIALPDIGSAMFLDQAMNMPQAQFNELDSEVRYSDISPDLLDLTHSVDEMLGVSMNYPRFFEFP